MIAFLMLVAASDVPFAGTLVVEPTLPDTEIFIDGLPCERSPCEKEVEAGMHTITVRKPGYETRTLGARVTVDERSFVGVKLYPEPASNEVRERVAKNVRIAAWSSLAVSAAAAITSVVINVAGYRPALSSYQQFAAAPSGEGLDAFKAKADLTQRAGELDRLNIATAAFAVASGLAAATSLTLFLVGPKPGAASATTEVRPMALSPVVAPTQGGAQLGFNLAY